MMSQAKLSKKEIRNELWRRGELRWILHGVQKEMYDKFNLSGPNSISVWLLARQSGKSFMLAVLAIEQALKENNCIIKLVTDTKQHVKSIFEPLFREILKTCPEDILPTYNTSQFIWNFPNGSQIQLAGSDNKNYEKLRGQKSVLVLIDEAGFCNDLLDMIKSVLLPTTLHTGGKIILSSTPPQDEDHPFLQYVEQAALNNTLTKKTILDNPLLTREQINGFIEQMGGMNSENCRRELFCEIVKSSTTSVLPEFTEEIKTDIVKEWPLPPFYDNYVSMDLGGKDLTAVIFAYYDFRADKIIIVDEIIFDFRNQGNDIEKLTQLIRQKEEELWLNPLTNETKVPYLRVSDINYIVLNEIRKYSNYQINFQPAKKDNLDAAINNLRTLIKSKKLIIHPKCVTTIRHLQNGRWSSSTTKHEFARSPDMGHYDALAACIYLCRSIQFNKNPYPKNHEYSNKDLFIANPERFGNNNMQIDAFKKAFNIPAKRKW